MVDKARTTGLALVLVITTLACTARPGTGSGGATTPTVASPSASIDRSYRLGDFPVVPTTTMLSLLHRRASAGHSFHRSVGRHSGIDRENGRRRAESEQRGRHGTDEGRTAKQRDRPEHDPHDEEGDCEMNELRMP